MTTFIKCLLLFGAIFAESNCAVIVSRNGRNGISGQFNIFTEGDKMHCGSLICTNASRCIITQKTDRNDQTKLITNEKCFDTDDNLIQKNEIITNADPNQGIIDVRYEAGSNGVFVTDPKLSKEIAENVEKTIADAMKNVQASLANSFNTPFFNSRFGGNIPNGNFPFGNSNPFGTGFPFGNSNPFGRGFPFNKNHDSKEDEDILTHKNGNSNAEPTASKSKTETRESVDSDEDILTHKNGNSNAEPTTSKSKTETRESVDSDEDNIVNEKF